MSSETSKQCPECHAEVEAHYIFCPACGARLLSVCARCGSPLKEGWSYCAFCGHKLADKDAPIGATIQAAQQELQTKQSRRADELNDAGSDLYDREEYEDALAKFTEAVKLNPDHALYRCNRALALQALGENEQALAEYKEAIKRNPTDPLPRLNLGYFHSENEDIELARKHFVAAVELAPDSPEAEEARDALASLEAG